MSQRGWLCKAFLIATAALTVAGCATHSATDADIADLAEMQLQGARGIVHTKQTALCAQSRGLVYCDLAK